MENLHTLYSILVIVDDVSDNPSFSRHSKLLDSLYTRARHFSISTIASTQKFAAVGQIMRVNSTCLCVCRLRHNKDLECLLMKSQELKGVKNYQKCISSKRKNHIVCYTLT